MQPVTGQSRPGYASPPMPPRPSAPVLRGSCRGPPRVRGWAMGGGSVGGGAGAPGREVGPSCQSPSPRAPPVGVTRCAVGVAVPPWCRTLPARRRPAAGGAGARGAIRVQQAGSPSGGWWSRRRLTTGRSLPYWVEGRGGLPGGRCRGGGHGRGIGLASVRRHACRQSAGRARSPASPPRYARRAPPRAPCAPAAKCVWGSLPRAQSPTHIAVRRLARRAAAAPRWASPRT